ncbi:MAG: M67 family metallopeptidase [Planctomycetota bacterium]|nr:M67 family metallopeptidase [Planctomycetota bacterium]
MPAQFVDVEVLSVHVPTAVRDELFRFAHAAAPREACGFVLGTGRAEQAEVVLATLARNLSDSAARFEAHPEDQLAAEREAERLGLHVLGSWHSHVHSAARPSAADLACTSYPLALILSLRDESLAAFAGPRELALPDRQRPLSR